MGSDAFDREQWWLTFGVLGVVMAWFAWGMLYLDYRFTIQDGNPIRLMREQTEYQTTLGYWFGEGGIVFYSLLILACIAGLVWLYRGYQDGWEFLRDPNAGHRSKQPAGTGDRGAPTSVWIQMGAASLLLPSVVIITGNRLARLGLWPFDPATGAAGIVLVTAAVCVAIWRHG